MSDKGPRADDQSQRPYRVSSNVMAQLRHHRLRNWRRAQQRSESPRRRYWVRCQRAYCRDLIHGELVAHRRMFGVSHKSVQPGEVQTREPK